MSTHPNVVLLLALTPDNTSRKTYRGILASLNIEDEDTEIKIGETKYGHRVMEDDYYEGLQLSAKEGDIILYDMVTYGYGERIEWTALAAKKESLQVWALDICEKFQCKFEIFITANYW